MASPSLESTPLQEVRIPCGDGFLPGDLGLPAEYIGVAVFVHGAGSGRHSARDRQLARRLHRSGVATLLFDLLTAQEEAVDVHTRQHRYDTALLTRRVEQAVLWAVAQPSLRSLPVGLIGANHGGAAALIAAAQLGDKIAAVVSRGGRPDLAGPAVLAAVSAPTLLVVGSQDTGLLSLNKEALGRLGGPGKLVVVPGASHRFDEPGMLDQVGELAASWFGQHLLRAEHVA